MKLKDQFSGYPYLKHLLVSYLLLGVTDTIHHLHAALALGHDTAMHAVALGVVLVPIAIGMVWLFMHYKKQGFVWVFLAITVLAILLPGIYHGGWDHLVKILAFLRVEGESTNINMLFPTSNFNYWFYEITGVLEFVLAFICLYFAYKYVSEK